MEWIWQGSLLPQWAWTISSLPKWIFSLHFHAGPEGPGATAATGKLKTELTGVRREASALFWSALKTLEGAHRSALGQRKREAFWHFLLRRHAILPRWSAPAALRVVSWVFFCFAVSQSSPVCHAGFVPEMCVTRGGAFTERISTATQFRHQKPDSAAQTLNLYWLAQTAAAL